MKVCVFGAGAVGGHAAARLARGGADVSVVARGPHLAAMQARGIEVRAPDATFRVDVSASDDPAQLGPQDVVLVTLKAPSLPAMAAAIQPLLGPDTAVAFAMNGIPWWYFYKEGGPHDGHRLERVDPGGVVWDAVGPHRVIGGVVNSACTVVEPGVVEVANEKSRITIGEPDGTISPRAEALAAALRAGGMGSDAVDDIRNRIWIKLMLNISSGPLGVLTQAAGAAMFADPVVCDAVHRIGAEMTTLAHAMGCPATARPDAQIANARTLRHTASIVQDLQLGRPMEVDAIYTVPLEIARMMNVPTPTLDLLVALTRLRANAAGLYGG
jgi:2-dehydropantoate 2-reductase